MTMLALLLAAVVNASPPPARPGLFPEDKACAAWKTRKTMFLTKKVEPVGINCALKASLMKEPAGTRVRVLIPVAAFDSGEPARDEVVRELLREKENPELEFLSRPYPPEEWDAVSKGPGALEGTLRIGAELFPLKAPIHFTGPKPAIEGDLISTMSAFKIKPPKVAGGVVAKVHDHLQLIYRVPLELVAKPQP